MIRRLALLALLGAASLTSGCKTANEYALELGKPPENAVKLRVAQTRRFDSVDEATMLIAATQIMQDLGFTISESNADLGVVGASKQRDAEESGEIAGQVTLTIMFALMGSYYDPTWGKEQTIRATVVLTPVRNANQTDVRISFDRLITNNHGKLWRSEVILDPEIYQQFFQKFSQSVFLEGHEI